MNLNGWSLDKASLMGMPHIGAHYTSGLRYEMDDGAPCAVCGRPATNCHHVVPKGMGGGSKVFTLQTPMGVFPLKSPLFALCGSGTTGCHGDFHQHFLTAKWVWDDPEFGRMWWSGELLSHGIAPHDAQLLDMGSWSIS